MLPPSREKHLLGRYRYYIVIVRRCEPFTQSRLMMMVGSRLADYDLELTVFRCSAVVAVST